MKGDTRHFQFCEVNRDEGDTSQSCVGIIDYKYPRDVYYKTFFTLIFLQMLCLKAFYYYLLQINKVK